MAICRIFPNRMQKSLTARLCKLFLGFSKLINVLVAVIIAMISHNFISKCVLIYVKLHNFLLPFRSKKSLLYVLLDG
jgi:hypothetical protein